jgi:hypothetical protein
MSDERLIRDPRDRKWKIECECGHFLPMDTYTECSKCGAHYRVELKQEAPPIAE